MFLGGNQTMSVGGSETFTLDRNDLAGVAGALGDGYYGEKDYWKEVTCTYESTNTLAGAQATPQKKTLIFRDIDTASLSFSATAIAGTYSLRSVIITDKDNGLFVIREADIPSQAFYDVVVS